MYSLFDHVENFTIQNTFQGERIKLNVTHHG